MRKDSHYLSIMYDIIYGFEKGKKHKAEGVEPEVTGNLTMLTVGSSKEKLDAGQYGYLLAQTNVKVTTTDAIKYFYTLPDLDESQVKKLFEKHKFNEHINRFNDHIKRLNGYK